jgi:CheY-like chemotaxis protein
MNPAHILIVDDHPDICSVLERVFTRSGYSVTTAADGLEALQLFEAHHPDALLLDIDLPGMSGFDVCQTIKEASTVPIILITGYPLDLLAAQKDVHGADLVVEKPFDLVCLREQLAQLLQS